MVEIVSIYLPSSGFGQEKFCCSPLSNCLVSNKFFTKSFFVRSHIKLGWETTFNFSTRSTNTEKLTQCVVRKKGFKKWNQTINILVEWARELISYRNLFITSWLSFTWDHYVGIVSKFILLDNCNCICSRCSDIESHSRCNDVPWLKIAPPKTKLSNIFAPRRHNENVMQWTNHNSVLNISSALRANLFAVCDNYWQQLNCALFSVCSKWREAWSNLKRYINYRQLKWQLQVRKGIRARCTGNELNSVVYF